MAKPAAHADGKSQSDLALTAVIARRKKDGKLVIVEAHQPKAGGQIVFSEHVLEENSDRALDLYAHLKRSKGEAGAYTHVACFLRSRPNRRLKFG